MKRKNVNGRRRGESSRYPHDRRSRYSSPCRVFKLSFFCVSFSENQEKTEDQYEENSHLNAVPHWINSNTLGQSGDYALRSLVLVSLQLLGEPRPSCGVCPRHWSTKKLKCGGAT